MKKSQIFHQYIWIINTLRTSQGLTFEELAEKWVKDQVADGNALHRSTFNRHRDAIVDMFGIIIECEKTTYRYYISNTKVLGDDSIERWLFSTLTVNGVLADSVAVKERVVLESVPMGLEYLQTIIQGIRRSCRIRLGYRKFGTEGYEKTVSPYALKLFHQRWYLLARTDTGEMRIYALDRVTKAELTDQSFTMPDDFSPQDYFSEYYGVLTDNTPLARIIVRAYDRTPSYLRTLPLHHSQRELHSTGQYTDFAYHLRPTPDFLGQLLSHGSGLEVMEPEELRQKMRQLIADNLKRY